MRSRYNTDGLIMVEETLKVLDSLEERRNNQPDWVLSKKLSQIPFPKGKLITIDSLKRKYPRFCSQLNLRDIDLAAIKPRSDVWMTRFMEECYTEAYIVSKKEVSSPKKRKRFGLDFGGLNAFPIVVAKFISRRIR